MPPPHTPGADWPVIKYGQSDPAKLPQEEFFEAIKQMVGRTIPSGDCAQVHEKWFDRNVRAPEFDSRQIAYRLYMASCPNPISSDDWLRGLGKCKPDSGVIDFRRFERSQYLYDVQCGKLFEQLGWAHNEFLPAVWNEKTASTKRWFEYFLSTQPENSAQMFTLSTRRVSPENYDETFDWFKNDVLPMVRDCAATIGGQLIFWRLDWGRIKAGVRANFHFHFAILFSTGGSAAVSKSWELRASLDSVLGRKAKVYYSSGITGDARRLVNYTMLPHSARDYAGLTDAELLEFFNAVAGVRRFQRCGPLYAFVAEKKRAGITSVKRVPSKGGWEFQGRKARPDEEPDEDEDDKNDDFDYHLRPFICSLYSSEYSLCLAIRPKFGSFGRIDLDKIKAHPWIANLIKTSNEALEKNLAAALNP